MIPDPVLEALDTAQAARGHSTRITTIHQAIHVYAKIINHQEPGDTLVLRKADGTEILVIAA